jgi:hypothetical protein
MGIPRNVWKKRPKVEKHHRESTTEREREENIERKRKKKCSRRLQQPEKLKMGSHREPQ